MEIYKQVSESVCKVILSEQVCGIGDFYLSSTIAKELERNDLKWNWKQSIKKPLSNSTSHYSCCCKNHFKDQW